MNSNMKENANPVVYAVKKTTKRRTNQVGNNDNSGVNRYNLSQKKSNLFFFDEDNNGGGGDDVPTTVMERCVHIALKSASASSSSSSSSATAMSKGESFKKKKIDSLSLLRNGGFDLPVGGGLINDGNSSNNSLSSILQIPTFVPNTKHSSSSTATNKTTTIRKESQEIRDEVHAEEVFDIIRNIQDPEHPLTLEQLNVVNLEHISVVDVSIYHHDDEKKKKKSQNPPKLSTVHVGFTPTIPHCSMATLIGLCIRVKLLRSLPSRFKVSVQIQPGTHASEIAINRQLQDKERVCAALENESLRGVVDKCILEGMMTT